MTGIYQSATGALRAIDDGLYAAWIAAENAKARGWTRIPDQPSPQHTWDGSQWVGPDVALLAAQLIAQIDSDVDGVYQAVIGERQAEYAEAERQAQAYADAGYTGSVPSYVASWVAASGLTPEAAAQSILSTAAAWRSAAAAMRAARLGHKAQARASTTVGQLDAVRSAWSAALGQIRSALGLS